MKRDVWILLAIVAAFSGVLAFRASRSSAPTPTLFDDGLTLEQAAERSRKSGMPVFVVATADSCAPCQTLKRGALSDESVVSFLREHTVPVYLEESSDAPAIRALGVRAFPTTILMLDGETLGVLEGGAAPRAYLETIRRALGVPG